MTTEDLGVIHDEGFISLTYNEEFDLWVLIIYYDTGSFNDTEITLHKNYNEAYIIFENKYHQIFGRRDEE